MRERDLFEFGVQEIFFEDMHVLVRREFLLQVIGECGMDFEHENLCTGFGEFFSDDAGAPAYFQDDAFGSDFGARDEIITHGFRNEKILRETLLGKHSRVQ